MRTNSSTIHSKKSLNFPFISPRPAGLSRATAFFAGALLATAAVSQAAIYTWNVDASSSTWGASADWSPNSGFPNATGDVADLTYAIQSANSIGLVQPITIGVLNIGSANSSSTYTVTSGTTGSLCFNNLGSDAQINQVSTSGVDTISAPISLATSLDISNASSKGLTFSGSISAASGGMTLSNLSGGGTGTVTVAGIISDGAGTMSVVQNSSTSILLLTGINTYSGGTTISSGTLEVGSGTSGNMGTGPVTVASGGTLLFAQSGVFSINNNISGAGVMTKSSSGEMILGGNNTYSGVTTIKSGTVQAASSGAFSPNSSFAIGQSGGGTAVLDLAGYNESIGGLSSAGTPATQYNVTNSSSNPATLTINSTAASSYAGVISSNLAITKTGNQTLTLSGNNTYTGATTIVSGTLSASISGAISNSAILDVQASGILGLSGISGGYTVGGSQTLEGTGKVLLGATAPLTVSGVIQPHDSVASSGTLTVSTGALTLANSSTYTLNLGGAVCDTIASTSGGSIALGNAASDRINLTINLTSQPVDGTVYKILSGSVTNTGEFTYGSFGALASGTDFWVNSNGLTEEFQITYGSTADTLTAIAVPEPSTWAMPVAGMGVILLFRRARRCRA